MIAIERVVGALLLAGAVAGALTFPRLLGGPPPEPGKLALIPHGTAVTIVTAAPAPVSHVVLPTPLRAHLVPVLRTPARPAPAPAAVPQESKPGPAPTNGHAQPPAAPPPAAAPRPPSRSRPSPSFRPSPRRARTRTSTARRRASRRITARAPAAPRTPPHSCSPRCRCRCRHRRRLPRTRQRRPTYRPRATRPSTRAATDTGITAGTVTADTDVAAATKLAAWLVSASSVPVPSASGSRSSISGGVCRRNSASS